MVEILCLLSMNVVSYLDVFGYDGDPLSVDGAQVRFLGDFLLDHYLRWTLHKYNPSHLALSTQ